MGSVCYLLYARAKVNPYRLQTAMALEGINSPFNLGLEWSLPLSRGWNELLPKKPLAWSYTTQQAWLTSGGSWIILALSAAGLNFPQRAVNAAEILRSARGLQWAARRSSFVRFRRQPARQIKRDHHRGTTECKLRGLQQSGYRTPGYQPRGNWIFIPNYVVKRY